MEAEGSLLCSHEPVTGPCPEQDESNPSNPISLRSIIIGCVAMKLLQASYLYTEHLTERGHLRSTPLE
jgi:hypothetical protein